MILGEQTIPLNAFNRVQCIYYMHHYRGLYHAINCPVVHKGMCA